MLASTGVAEVLLVAQDRVPRPALPLRRAGHPLGGARAAGAEPGQHDPDARRPPPRPGSGRGSRRRRSVRLVVQRSPSLERGRRVPAQLGAGDRRAAAGRTTSCSPATTSPRPATRGSRCAATASGCRISTPRTARTSTARASRARSGWTRGRPPRRRDRPPAWRSADDARRCVRGGERHRAQAAPQRGQLRRRAAALRRRRRDGRRPGRRGRVAARRLGPRGRRLRRARGDEADRRADPGGEPPHLRPRLDRSHRLGHGHDDDGRARRGDDRRDRPRRRLARLPRPRRADGAAHRGPLARERAAEEREALGARRRRPTRSAA